MYPGTPLKVWATPVLIMKVGPNSFVECWEPPIFNSCWAISMGLWCASWSWTGTWRSASWWTWTAAPGTLAACAASAWYRQSLYEGVKPLVDGGLVQEVVHRAEFDPVKVAYDIRINDKLEQVIIENVNIKITTRSQFLRSKSPHKICISPPSLPPLPILKEWMI